MNPDDEDERRKMQDMLMRLEQEANELREKLFTKQQEIETLRRALAQPYISKVW